MTAVGTAPRSAGSRYLRCGRELCSRVFSPAHLLSCRLPCPGSRGILSCVACSGTTHLFPEYSPASFNKLLSTKCAASLKPRSACTVPDCFPGPEPPLSFSPMTLERGGLPTDRVFSSSRVAPPHGTQLVYSSLRRRGVHGPRQIACALRTGAVLPEPTVRGPGCRPSLYFCVLCCILWSSFVPRAGTRGGLTSGVRSM